MCAAGRLQIKQHCNGSLSPGLAESMLCTIFAADYLRRNYHVSISQDYTTTPFWMVRHADGGPGRGAELELSYACLTVDEEGQVRLRDTNAGAMLVYRDT